ncbi:FAD-dependent oxidoreductase [Francisella sp. Scap27]|uniref:FAD-dependent oxidoreductase n=1 Tax=Francisella sp. Scap27 TaxID=2589986 RepID=UPI0015B7A596|nr:FAD-dependent oxidoreductase [Francisella sp. Scap27]QLE79482.1 FAD-dependent oxidoreductase [Francisella sp. Scap27]
MKKIAIIGSGVMGRVLALTFTKNIPHLGIDLYDKASLGAKDNCSYQAAGMLAPVSEVTSCGIHTYTLGADSVQLWEELLSIRGENLVQKHNIIDKFDTLFLAHKNDVNEFDLIKNRVSFFTKQHESIKERFRNISSDDLSSLESSLMNGTFMNKGLLITNEGVINVPSFFKFTSQYFSEESNIRFLKEEITKIENNKIYIDEYTCEYEYVYDCRGFPIEKSKDSRLYGTRGEALIVQHKDINLKHVIRLAHPRHPLYLIPRGNGVFYVGATSILSEDYSSISVQSVMELLSMLLVIDKRFSEARLIKTLTSVRSTSFDDKPLIIRNMGNTSINGLSRHGYLFAPKIANDLLEEFKKDIYEN